MRRAIAAALVGGLVLGGSAVTPPAAAAAASTMKTVVYQGYEFQVPASWPVYRLDEHPQTCVRYDVHAVYLGTPGPDMRCPAGLIGRTQTVSFLPGHGPAAGAGVSLGRPGQVRGQREGQRKGQQEVQEANGTELQRLSAVHGMIRQNPVRHELAVAVGTARLDATVLGTYGTNSTVVEQVLNTLQLAPAGTRPTAQTAAAPSLAGGTTAEAGRRAEPPPLLPQRGIPALIPVPAGQPAQAKIYRSWRGVPAQWPVQIVQPPQQPAEPVSGFDTCTAPPLTTMKAWRSAYSAVGVYIGGANAACAGGNLSASWVRRASNMGWGVLPTYVGPQAPCWGGSGVLINPAIAAADGEAAALDAADDAQAVGLAAGSPIYYDMEGYVGSKSCTDAVLAFLGAWDRTVDALGYVTGVYSSQDSGITDVQAATAGGTLGFTPPDAVWVALWDHHPSLGGGNLTWPVTDRSKQYSGNFNATVGGITMNIDRDIVGGPVARLPIRILHRRRGTWRNQFA